MVALDGPKSRLGRDTRLHLTGLKCPPRSAVLEAF